MGEPIAIPGDLSREQLGHYIDLAQQAMDRLNEQAQRMISRSRQQPMQTENRAAA